MATRKVLTVTIEFDLSDRKNGSARLKNAYKSAVSAAVSAAKGELLDESIRAYHTDMTFDYRRAEIRTVGASSEDWDDDLDVDNAGSDSQQ